MFKKMVSDFPESPMAHFSLGKWHLEEKQAALAVLCFQKAVALDAHYSAAWLCLGDAFAALRNSEAAKESWNAALQTPHAHKDASLRADLEQRIVAVDEF
jgi:Tfp pilus assembly protein PilF